RRPARFSRDWSSDVCSSDLPPFRGCITLLQLLYVTEATGNPPRSPDAPPLAARGSLGTQVAPGHGDFIHQRENKMTDAYPLHPRSEERRVGKGRRARGPAAQ